MKPVREFYRTREDGVDLYRTHSTRGMKIRKVGTNEVYSEAIDVDGAPYIYEETEEPIEKIELVEPVEAPIGEA